MRQYLWVEARPIVFQQERSSIVLDAQGTVSTAPPRIHKLLEIIQRDKVALESRQSQKRWVPQVRIFGPGIPQHSTRLSS
jgi:hypothetical protein